MKKIASSALLCLLLSFLACNNSLNTKKPSYIPHDSVMVEMLAHVELLEAYFKQKRFRKQELNQVREVEYTKLFNRFHINKDTFNLILNYYKDDPEHLSQLYLQVSEKIDTLRVERPNDEKE